MSHSGQAASLKRKRPGSNPATQSLPDSEIAVLNVITSKEDMGIWVRDIKRDTKLSDTVVNKSLKSLMSKRLIKEVVNIQNKGRKHYMGINFEPSKEVTGGSWYVDGKLDEGYINELKVICLRVISSQKVATVETVHDFLEKKKAVNVSCTKQQIGEIVNALVLDDEIIEVKSTGLGEYHSIPVGAQCYRIATVGGGGGDKGPKIGAMASIPCGMCPRIGQCTPDGIISPKTCEYYKKWLDIEF